MIKAIDLVEKFVYALANDWGYIWGKSGQKWTEANQKAASDAEAIKYGKQWIGHYVADCSGMFVWAFKQLGSSIYHGSNTIYNKYCSSKGSIVNGVRGDGKPIKIGTAVFLYRSGKMSHIGLYVGNNKCIEARSTKDGVVTSNLAHWDNWGELKDVDYEGAPEDSSNVTFELPILRKGATGANVSYCQTLLSNKGYYVEVDGIYGTKTIAAVKRFQQDHGLDADGKVGPLTWAELEKSTEDLYTVTINKLTWPQVQSIREKYPEAYVSKE